MNMNMQFTSSEVALLLFFFRSIYGEVGTALPLNGGSYNCLLNSTRYTSFRYRGPSQFAAPVLIRLQ